MVFHVKFFFVADVIVNTALSKHGIDTIVLSEKNIAEFFLAFDFFHDLFCFAFLTEFVNKSVDDIV